MIAAALGETTVAFYRDVLALMIGPRPAFPFVGAWLYADGRRIVHLKVQGAQVRSDAALDHVAFNIDDFSDFTARLDRLQSRGVPGPAMHARARLPRSSGRVSGAAAQAPTTPATGAAAGAAAGAVAGTVGLVTGAAYWGYPLAGIGSFCGHSCLSGR